MVQSSRNSEDLLGGYVLAASRTREGFLAEDLTATELGSVRHDIAMSWRRSQRMGVEPDSVEVPYNDDVPMPHRLLDAAVPVVDQLASQLTDTSATILLASSEAHIVQRWACRSFLPTLDRFNVAPGFSFAEHGVGTNGIGCAAEEKRLFEVRGPEHFRECLQSLVCVAAPIVLPTTNVTQGVLNVTCTVNEANGFLKPLLQHIVADIERRMLESSSVRERLLLDAYLSRTRRTSNGVIAMSEGIVMANPAADAMLSSSDRVVLWQWACDALSTRDEAARRFDVDGGGELAITATAIGDRRPSVGALLELRPEASAERVRSTLPDHDRFAESIAGRSSAARQLRRAIGLAAHGRSHVVVVGPDGAGRTHVARAIAGDGRAAEAVPTVNHVVDLETADAAAVIVRKIERWDPVDVENLLGTADSLRIRVFATADDQSTADATVRCFGHRIEVPSLARRIDDIPELTRQLLIELSGEHRRHPVRPDAMAALMSHDWPGNISELRATLSVALAAAGRADISVFHLPESLRIPDTGARWTTLERAEREAIMAAMSEHEGNKVAAAAALGVARSTLYRKLRAFQIDVA